MEERLLLQLRTIRESHRSAVQSLRLMPAEHRDEAIGEIRARALGLLAPLRAEIGARASQAMERELLDAIHEIDQSA